MKEPISENNTIAITWNLKIIILIAALAVSTIIIAFAFSGQGNGTADRPVPDDRITIIDAYGREVILKSPAKRVVYTHHSLTDSFKLIGAWDQVVGRDANVHDEKMFPGLDEIPAVCPSMNSMDLNYEKIMELHPDVVILPKFDWYSGSDEIIKKLEPDIPVVFLDTLDQDPRIACDTIRKLGIITGNEARAEEFITFYSGVYNRIEVKTSLVKPEDRPYVFFKAIGKSSPSQITTYGRDMPWARSFFGAAGARNVAGDLPIAYGEVDNEWLLGQDIDVIIAKCWEERYPDIFGYTVSDRKKAIEGAEKIRKEIMKTEVFANTDAVREGRVYLFHDSMDATQRNIIGIAYLAKWLYPDEFSDLDPEAIHQEYLNRFMETDYVLDNAGLFAYPA